MAVASDLSLPVVLHRITESACELVGARYGALGVLGADGTLAEFVTVGVDFETIERIGHPPVGRGVLGIVINRPEPLRIDDLSTHPSSFGFPPHHPAMHSFIGAPIRVRGAVFGNLYLTEKLGGGAFTADDEELLVALAAAAGVAIENARLHALVREYAVVEDRERIGRDLHDKVIQRIFATGMALQAASRLVHDPEVARRISVAVDDLDETIRVIRSTIFALGQRPAGRGSVRAEVLALAAEATPALGFEPQVIFDGPIDAAVGDGIVDHLLSTLREGLTNIAKHAAARRVGVRVTAASDLVLELSDDGKGFDPEVPFKGFGVRNMGERARALGGSCQISPGPRGGTVLEWRVPLERGGR